MGNVDPRLMKIRELAKQAIGPLAAIERELTNCGILAGAETMAIASHCAALRLMLQRTATHFGEPDPLLPAVRFEPPVGYR